MKKVKHIRQERRIHKLCPVYYNRWWARKINAYFDNLVTDLTGRIVSIIDPTDLMRQVMDELEVSL